MSHRLAPLVVSLVLALALGPTVAFAETFTLPGGEQLLHQIYYCSGSDCPSGIVQEQMRYTYTPVIIYRTLIGPDGAEAVLDHYRIVDGRMVYSPTSGSDGNLFYFFDLPAFNISLDEPGTYYVELKRIDVNRPTVEHNAITDLGATVDLWGVQGGYASQMPECTYVYRDDCYYEYLIEKNVPIESLAQTLSVTEIDVAGGIVTPEQPLIAGSAGGPFNPNTGDAQKQDDGIPLAVAGLGGIAAVSAVALASGSRIKTYLTTAGIQAEEARAAAYAQMEADKQRLADWYAGIQADKAKAKQTAASEQQQARADQFNADLAEIQSGKLSAADAGSAYAALTTKYSDVLTDEGKKQLMDYSNQAWKANNTMIATATLIQQQLAGPFEANKGTTSKPPVASNSNGTATHNSFAQDLGNWFGGQRNDYDAYKKARPTGGIFDVFNKIIDNGQFTIDAGFGMLKSGKDFAVDTISMAGYVAAHPVETAVAAGSFLSGLKTAEIDYKMGLLTKPIETLTNTWNGLTSFAGSVRDGLTARYNEGADSGHPGIGIGNATFDIASILVPVGGGAKAAQGAKLARGAEEARGLMLAKDVVQMNGKNIVAENVASKTLTTMERSHLNSLIPSIENSAAKSEITKMNILYNNFFGGAWAAATRNKLLLDVQNPIETLLSRKTMEHEISGHIELFQTRFFTEGGAQKYLRQVKDMRGGLNSWLDENEANSMLKIAHGDETFNARVNALTGDIKDLENIRTTRPITYLELIKSPDFIENLASVENLRNYAGMVKNNFISNVRKDLFANSFISPQNYNKIVEIMSQNTNNILNGNIISKNEILKYHKIIANILYS